MDDKKLADRVVALGFLYWLPDNEGNDTFLSLSGESRCILLNEDREMQYFMAVRDWRVAGALMEKYPDGFSYWFDNKWKAGVVDLEADTMVSNESLPRAIIEACCEALCE